MLLDKKLWEHTGSKEVRRWALTSPACEKEIIGMWLLMSNPSVFTYQLVVSTDAKQESGACWGKFPMCALLRAPKKNCLWKGHYWGVIAYEPTLRVPVWVWRPIRNYSVVHPCAFVSSVWCCLLCVVSLFSPLQRSDVAVVYNQSRLCQARVIITHTPLISTLQLLSHCFTGFIWKCFPLASMLGGRHLFQFRFGALNIWNFPSSIGFIHKWYLT